MNRKMLSFVAALLALAATTFAQNSGEPSESSVLDAARAKFWGDQSQPADSSDTDQAASRSDATAIVNRPYTPFILAFVPGLQLPLGMYDTSLSLAYIGVATGNVLGFQGAGVFNLSRDVAGFQGAGVFNLARKVEGFQAAGVFNMARDVDGFQSAGVFNIADGKVSGFQGAGVFNIAGDIDAPLQGAGVFNIAHRVAGFQAAGVFNIADDIKGGQISGGVNVAKKASGIQLGVVNIADEMDGVQLGLVNVARNGVNSIGAFYEPSVGYTYGYWQAGTPYLYTVAGIGMPNAEWFNGDANMKLSFGFGTRIRLHPAYIDIDVSAESAVGSRLADFCAMDAKMQTETAWRSVWPTPYPVIKLAFGLPIAHRFHLVGGLKLDIDVAANPMVPRDLRVGKPLDATLFGTSFTAWPKWFLGVKI